MSRKVEDKSLIRLVAKSWEHRLGWVECLKRAFGAPAFCVTPRSQFRTQLPYANPCPIELTRGVQWSISSGERLPLPTAGARGATGPSPPYKEIPMTCGGGGRQARASSITGYHKGGTRFGSPGNRGTPRDWRVSGRVEEVCYFPPCTERRGNLRSLGAGIELREPACRESCRGGMLNTRYFPMAYR